MFLKKSSMTENEEDCLMWLVHETAEKLVPWMRGFVWKYGSPGAWFLEVAHRSFYCATGTFVEGCQNRQNNDFSKKLKTIFYYLKIHDDNGIACRHSLAITVQNFMPLTSGKLKLHLIFLLFHLRTNFGFHIVGRVLLWFFPMGPIFLYLFWQNEYIGKAMKLSTAFDGPRRPTTARHGPWRHATAREGPRPRPTACDRSLNFPLSQSLSHRML